jgi:hypothetical protein
MTRATVQYDVPGAYGASYSYGVKPETYSISCYFLRSNSAQDVIRFQQLKEIASNPLMDWEYIRFPELFSEYNGFYHINDVRPDHKPAHVGNLFPFTLTVTKKGSGDLRVATYWWSNVAETLTGWTGLTATRMVSLPNGATNVANTVAATRTASDGTIQILENPTRQEILYTSSSTFTDWYLAECRVYDSVTAGNTTESGWVQVFSPMHQFTGDTIIQNGLLRCVIGSSVTTWYVYESAVTSTWVSVGTFLTAMTGNVNATTVQVELLRVTPDVIQWRTIRQYGANPINVVYILRRGAYHCRISLTPQTLGIDTATYIQLSKSGGFTKLFNSASNGNAGSGNLNLDTTDSYECGYNTSANVVAGFVLLDQPGKQPYDPGVAGNLFPLGLTWIAGTTRTFFLIAWPQATSSFNLTTGRTNAASIAAEAREYIEEETILTGRSFNP